MSVYLEPRMMKEDLILGYKDNHVSFRYAGLWFSNPEKVFYQVMLEGYDLGWIDTYDRPVTYSSLPPGKYTFRVRSSTGSVVPECFGSQLLISRSENLFWLSPWFIILIIIVMAAFIYLVIRLPRRKMQPD